MFHAHSLVLLARSKWYYDIHINSKLSDELVRSDDYFEKLYHFKYEVKSLSNPVQIEIKGINANLFQEFSKIHVVFD